MIIYMHKHNAAVPLQGQFIHSKVKNDFLAEWNHCFFMYLYW